jgi:hypothetical protein
MTLEKAIKEKNKLGETTEITGVTYQVIIAPLREKDFSDFTNTYNGEELNDDFAISYSTNQQSRLSAIKVFNGNKIKEQTLKK